MSLNGNTNSKERYIIVKDDSRTQVSIKHARIIKFGTGMSITVEILGLLHPKESIFHVGEIYEMDIWDFNDNYKYIDEIDLLAKVL